MGLTKTQQMLWEKSRAAGSGGQAVGLTDGTCAYLVGRIAFDLGLEGSFPEVPEDLPEFFHAEDLNDLVIHSVNARTLFERLVTLNTDADMYYACLATLHKARLKYDVILRTQPIPTLEQVGPRGLLQYGRLAAPALGGFLFWRKWFYDIDNRAGQETGYLFEPVIANAIGGIPKPASKSPVKRHRDRRKGRQIDCLLGRKAYELKIRVTIAASGQGRWREELDFPIDCRQSGYDPVLVVLDGTPNPKLQELERAFRSENGDVYIGEDAWDHLDSLAGTTMSRFLDKYVRLPINDLLESAPSLLPTMVATMDEQSISISLGDETLRIAREVTTTEEEEEENQLPFDISDEIPG